MNSCNPTNNPLGSGAGLIDHTLGDAYKVVKAVYDALPTLSDSLASAGGGGAGEIYFFDMATYRVPTYVNIFTSVGYLDPGIGQGTYVNDGFATLALAMVHPRFCKQSLDGRYWRLIGDTITPEQAGASGVAGSNDQPAFAAMAIYKDIFHIPKIKLGKPYYEMWCPIRTSFPGYADTDGAGGEGHLDGWYWRMTTAVEIIGLASITEIKYFNSLGNPNVVGQTGNQVVSGIPWSGGALLCFAPPSSTTKSSMVARNLVLDGTGFYDPTTNSNAGQNIYHKGVMANYNGGLWKKLEFDNVEVKNCNGELTYFGGDANSLILTYNSCRFHGSAQSAWNPTGLGKVLAIGMEAGDAYLASEIITGAGHTYIKGRFYNCYNCGTIGTESFQSGYFYGYPNYPNDRSAHTVDYVDTTFENCLSVNVGNFTKGSVIGIDTYFALGGLDIRLHIKAFTDQQDGNIIASLRGPLTDTTQSYGSPTGVYDERVRDVHITIEHYRTRHAILAGRTNINAVQFQGGLIDKNSVSIHLIGEFNMAIQRGQYPVANEVLPLITFGNMVWLRQPGGGDYNDPSGDLTVLPNLTGMALNPTGVGVLDLIMASTDGTHPYAVTDGQIFTFHINGGTGRPVRAKANGNGFSLRQDLIIVSPGDELQVQWSDQANAWHEYRHKTSRASRLTGSVIFDPASLAVGAKTGIQTMAVAGAALGDFIEGVSFSLNLAGVDLRAWVSAADTVSFFFINENGADPVDLASGTVSVVVRRAL